MSNEVGKKMSEYTPLEDLTQAEQETYLANAAVTTYGKTSVGGANTNVNVPLSAIKPDVPVTDVKVDGASVLNAGVAEITMPSVPTAASLAGDGLDTDTGKLKVKLKNDGGLTVDANNGVYVNLPIPPVSGITDGYVLTKTTDTDNNTDTIEWHEASGGSGSDLPPYTAEDDNKILKVTKDGNKADLKWDTLSASDIPDKFIDAKSGLIKGDAGSGAVSISIDYKGIYEKTIDVTDLYIPNDWNTACYALCIEAANGKAVLSWRKVQTAST